jgi:hypothetical protein
MVATMMFIDIKRQTVLNEVTIYQNGMIFFFVVISTKIITAVNDH